MYKSDDSVEVSNNTLTAEKRKVDKINKISDFEKKKETLFLSDSIIKDIKGWRLNRCLKSSVSGERYRL